MLTPRCCSARVSCRARCVMFLAVRCLVVRFVDRHVTAVSPPNRAAGEPAAPYKACAQPTASALEPATDLPDRVGRGDVHDDAIVRTCESGGQGGDWPVRHRAEESKPSMMRLAVRFDCVVLELRSRQSSSGTARTRGRVRQRQPDALDVRLASSSARAQLDGRSCLICRAGIQARPGAPRFTCRPSAESRARALVAVSTALIACCRRLFGVAARRSPVRPASPHVLASLPGCSSVSRNIFASPSRLRRQPLRVAPRNRP